jgi:hypothetical protein
MLERVDRMLLAVRSRAKARETFATMLGAQWLRDETSSHLNAAGSVLALGESELELWEASGPGVVQTHLDRAGEGLLFAGYATSQFDALAARLVAHGVTPKYDKQHDNQHEGPHDNQRMYLASDTTFGFPMVISAMPASPRPRVGQVSFFYEATNALNTDWQVVARRYSELFALDASRFAPIKSPRFGYEGSLTLFDPAQRLDRIELSQTFADKPGAMRKFVEKRGGDSFYMCFVEAHDFDGLRERLLAAGASLTARGGDPISERDTMWVHPKNLHGMLLGVSRTGFGWIWSGQPQRVPVL